MEPIHHKYLLTNYSLKKKKLENSMVNFVHS